MVWQPRRRTLDRRYARPSEASLQREVRLVNSTLDQDVPAHQHSARQDSALNDRPNSPLAALIARASELGGGSAPVHKWNPTHCGTIPMRIAADGTWFYNGTPILRERLVRLFASILRREPDGEFVLVTPVEKVGIEVEDAPFQAVELVVDGEGEATTMTVRTNMGDVVTVGSEHPLSVRLDPQNEGFIPYVRVRGELDARFTRPAALELAELAAEGADGRLEVWSDGVAFPLEERSAGDRA
ncbi:DUF1285 domain-containing protein [Acuticoccus sediminis]|uniref:DUF1285 domain-containing protein n=1 Tax=Acuticoccus sediminis TaxID=2184697 RepID=A0A8B2NY55_9HYPH|nr:DUF1285 domain-containing protein [Acuticoccus sediminis]